MLCTKCSRDDWKEAHPPSARARGRKAYFVCRYCRKENVKAWRSRLKGLCIEAYGGKCACCGETELAFLCIDHVDGGGTLHRQAVGRGSWLVYADIKKRGFPPGFQVLCANCNMAKELPEGCPHQHIKVAVV